MLQHVGHINIPDATSLKQFRIALVAIVLLSQGIVALWAQETTSKSDAGHASAAQAADEGVHPASTGGLSLPIKILIGVAAVVVLFLVFVALKPAEFRIERSKTINAPPAVVFAQVNELRNWEAWSPWLKMDPNAKLTYEGPSSGTGAIYSWAGNNKLGEGRMTVVESQPNSLFRIKLEFFKPFAATNMAEFTFTPDGQQTVVVWRMDGRNNFVSKLFHVLLNIDKMVGGQFDEGLTSIKSIAEAKQ